MKLKITVDNKTYEVDVEVAEDERQPPAGVQYYAQAGAVSLPPRCPAPDAGRRE